MLVSAHRGGGGDAVHEQLPGLSDTEKRTQWENRLETFKEAFEKGFRSVELDVWNSKDGEPMVIHDGNLKRTHGVDVNVKDATAETLRNEHHIPTLKDVLDLAEKYPDANGKPPKVFVELKSKRTTPYAEAAEKTAAPFSAEDKLLAETVAKEIGSRVASGKWGYDDLPVIGFCHEQLFAASNADSKIKFGLSFEQKNFGAGEAEVFSDKVADVLIDYTRKSGASTINPDHHLLDKQGSFVKKAHAAGLEVNTWTVNDKQALKDVQAQGVDTAITDFPRRAQIVVDDLAKSQQQQSSLPARRK